MDEEMTFGEILKQTRERKGLDLNATARRLRIRPDILRAIEAGNFAAMPPRGYTRNMVNGYARYLGLNATDITGMYLEELSDYQQGISSARQRGTGFDMSDAPDNSRFNLGNVASRFRTGEVQTQASRTAASSQRSSRRKPGESYVDGLESMESSRGVSSRDGRTVFPEGRMYQSRGSVLPASSFIDQRAGDSEGGLLGDFQDKLPYVIAAAVVLILVIVLSIFLFGGHDASEEPAAGNMPITGVDGTQGGTDATTPSDGTAPTDAATTTPAATTEPAPTSAKFEFSVADGYETYIEVYVDGERVYMEDLVGPVSQSYDFSDQVEFIASEIDQVTVKIDGAEEELVDDGNGVLRVTYRFSDVLAKWLSDHPGASVSANTTTGSTGDNASSADASAGDSNDGGDSSANDDESNEDEEGDEEE